MPSAAGRTPRSTGAVIGVLCLAGTTVSLQQTLVVALLPSFAELFAISADDASWLITATLLTSAVATPVVARLADMYGKRLMMIVCILLMACGSLVAALSAGSFAVLIVGRALQGFSAALIPVGISIMRDELPKERVSSAIALMSATLGIGGALGLPLGGLLFGRFGWSSVFWLSVVVGLAILVAVIVVVPESGVKTRGRFDLLGALLLSAALTCLLLVISKGASWGGESVALLLTATAVLLAVWFPYTLKVSQPLVDLRTSARRPVLFTNLASILVGFALMGNILISTQQLQLPTEAGGYGLGALAAGLAMVPGGLAMVAFSPVSGRMINVLGGRITLITGCAIMGVAYIGRVFLDHSLLSIVIGSTVVSVGSAIAYAAMPSLIMANVPITETASANGLNALLRALGTSTASAVIAGLLTAVTITVNGETVTSPAAFTITYWLAGAVSLLACGIVWLVPRPTVEPVVRPAAEVEPVRRGQPGRRGHRDRRPWPGAPTRRQPPPARGGDRGAADRRAARLESGRQRGCVLPRPAGPRPLPGDRQRRWLDPTLAGDRLRRSGTGPGGPVGWSADADRDRTAARGARGRCRADPQRDDR